ncbi:hypothetical protein K7X08_002543 [Anisodus acutangulus]|uniref:Uncharacterized protein n=1 Tax=Anisodus acutangulus TaxID=402998 RepID=A0A9Q1LPN2_9SOLA|nr:hypothetical protein K7X08_002543 [Anisodus acutangulus]
MALEVLGRLIVVLDTGCSPFSSLFVIIIICSQLYLECFCAIKDNKQLCSDCQGRKDIFSRWSICQQYPW